MRKNRKTDQALLIVLFLFRLTREWIIRAKLSRHVLEPFDDALFHFEHGWSSSLARSGRVSLASMKRRRTD